MFRKQRSPEWPIDSANVTFGSVVDGRTRNLSRSHVRVRFRGAEPMLMPVRSFARRCHVSMRDGVPLLVEHLLVAPILRRRHADFFDRLTDWCPAEKRARDVGTADAWARP